MLAVIVVVPVVVMRSTPRPPEPVQTSQAATPQSVAPAEETPAAALARQAAPTKGVITPLMLAAERGDLGTAEALLTARAPVDATDADGRTALMYAARGARFNVIKRLVEYGAAVDARCDRGMTPLAYAVAAGYRDGIAPTIGALLARGAEVDPRDFLGATPLMLAAGAGDLVAASTLHNNRAELNARDYAGNNALDYVLAPREKLTDPQLRDHCETMSVLLNRGIDPDLRTDTARVPILCRDELNAALVKKGFASMPPLVAPIVKPTAAGMSLWPSVPWGRATELPPELSGLLLDKGGELIVPTVLARREMHVPALAPGHRVFLSSDMEGKTGWYTGTATVFEVYRRSSRESIVYAGFSERLLLGSQPLQLLGSLRTTHPPPPVDITPLFTGGTDKVVITLLSNTGWGQSTALYLNVRGPDAERIVRDTTVWH